MGRLHDMKKGIVTKTGSAIGKFIGKKTVDLAAICAKEDPAKVRAFLEDVANEPSLPAPVRLECKRLLESYQAGKPLEEAMQEQTEENIHTLENNLTVDVKK